MQVFELSSKNIQLQIQAFAEKLNNVADLPHFFEFLFVLPPPLDGVIVLFFKRKAIHYAEYNI